MTQYETNAGSEIEGVKQTPPSKDARKYICVRSKVRDRTVVLIAITLVALFRYKSNNDTIPLSLSRASLTTVKEMSNYTLPDKEDKEDDFGLDVFVIGFAKTGTSSLLRFMMEDHELAMLPHENSDLRNGAKGLADLKAKFDKMPNSTNMKKGIKCPSAVRDTRQIRNLAKYTTKDTKLILGVRHPIKFFQSFYNYKVKHLHATNKSTSHIPRAEDLVGDQSHSWNKLYTEVARFEMFMKQLAKVDVSGKELKEMKKLGLKMVPNPYKIFLYNVDQLGDKNEERSAQFRSDLQEYLGLKESIPPLPEHNVNHDTFPEYLDVCDDEHKEFRELMMSQGNETARWIRDEFMESLDVIVGGKDFFLELLETWGSEICQTE